MGTNYYLVNKETDERLHIGKSSGGWCFALRVHHDRHIDSLSHWVSFFTHELYFIEDEYGDVVHPLTMYLCITDRPTRYDRQLLRHPVDQFHCIANCHGSYDLIVGEFS